MLGESPEQKPKNAKERKVEKLKAKRAEKQQAKLEEKKNQHMASVVCQAIACTFCLRICYLIYLLCVCVCSQKETAASMKMVRAAKSKAAKLRESGIAPSIAGKMAIASIENGRKRKSS